MPEWFPARISRRIAHSGTILTEGYLTINAKKGNIVYPNRLFLRDLP